MMLRSLLGVVLALSATCLSANEAVVNSQELKPFLPGSARAILTARAGRPFVLALWSVSCVHCRAELDMLATLSKRHPDLDIVLVSTDSPEESQAISSILRRYSLDRADSWVFADDFSERLRSEVDRQWRGELPRSYLYGPGNVVRAFSGALDQAEVEQWLRVNEKVVPVRE